MLITLIMAVTSAGAHIEIPELQSEQIDVVFLELPHGEASLLTNAAGEHILINTASSRSQKQLHEILAQLNVDKIDMVMLTGIAEEYSGNLAYLTEHYQVKKVLIPDVPSVQQDIEADVEFWPLNKDYLIWDHLSVHALDQSSDGNLSFLLTYGQETILFLNQHGNAIENKLFQLDKHIPIIKIASFGSGNSPSEELLTQLDPYICIVFPSRTHEVNDSLIERLSATWIDVYFLKQSGTVFLRLDKNDYEILTGNSAMNA